MRIAIEGCTHGELEKTYQTIKQIEDRDGVKVDLLLCCGDFQSTRNLSDLSCMACPDKYKSMCSFYKYYSGEAIAPVLTVFIGGNHEATNYLQELAYGGWVAPNIFYMGYAGVVEVNGVRIGGLSGIFKGRDYLLGHFERPPYDDNSCRSAYHIRNLEVFRLKQLENNPPDIMLSHDWPGKVYNHGDLDRLLRYKKHFRDDVEQGRLGSPPTRDILDTLKPTFWFSAHLHVKFAALVPHQDTNKTTKFLALDKCLPRRQFLQVLDVGQPIPEDDLPTLRFCPYWLSILRSTNHLLSVERKTRYTPGPGSSERWDFRPSEAEAGEVKSLLSGDLDIPYNFSQTALAYKETGARINMRNVPQPQATVNKQTTAFCSKLGILDPMALLVGESNSGSQWSYHHQPRDASEIDISHIEEEQEVNTVQEEQAKVEEESKNSRLNPISIPEPKLDNSQAQFKAVMESMVPTAGVEDNNLFVIDTVGEKPQEEINDVPVKKLKRRNAAMYASTD